MEPYCVSFNLDKRTDGNEKYKCELNDVTYERHEEDWKEDENFFHVSAEVMSFIEISMQENMLSLAENSFIHLSADDDGDNCDAVNVNFHYH